MLYDRKMRAIVSDSAPSGVYGQISLAHLINIMEAAGVTRNGESITHLEVVDDVLRFRVEINEEGTPRRP